MSLRATEEAEVIGIDEAEHGEFAYDYVELTREILNAEDVSGDGSKHGGSRYSGEHMHLPLTEKHNRDDVSGAVSPL